MERRCDCDTCQARRLAMWLFVAMIGVMFLIAAVHHAGEKPPLLINAAAPICTPMGQTLILPKNQRPKGVRRVIA